MSITVRLWNNEDLQAIKTDKWIATIFMNGKTFSAKEIKHYPYNKRRIYKCTWLDINDEHTHTIYATDEKMLLKFIDAEYVTRPDTIHQIITQYRPVKF